MRPSTYRQQTPEKRCGNCRFAHVPMYKDDLLCFFGDTVSATKSDFQAEKSDIYFNGSCVGLMDGEDYSTVWHGRVVDETDVCDEWEAA